MLSYDLIADGLVLNVCGTVSLLGSDVSSLLPAQVCLQRCPPYTSSVHNYPLPAENQALELFPKCLSDTVSPGPYVLHIT